MALQDDTPSENDRNGSKADIALRYDFPVLQGFTCACVSSQPKGNALLQLARTRRPRRAAEWTEAKAVTFIVTLAASRSVTLAASRAGMSRKAAYALKSRDPLFASAWGAAIAAAAVDRRGGDKSDEVNDPKKARVEGYRDFYGWDRRFDAQMRDQFFFLLANRLGDPHSASLAAGNPLP